MQFKTTKKITQDVINVILEIKKEKGLTASAVIKEAQKKKSLLHDFFEWDDTEAAHKWRLQQARVLINEIKIVVDNQEFFAFENVSIQVTEEDSEREYKDMLEIVDDDELKQQIVKKAYEQLLYWKNKYRSYAEFQLVFDAIEEVKKEIDAIEEVKKEIEVF